MWKTLVHFPFPADSSLKYYDDNSAVKRSSAAYHNNSVKRFFERRAQGHTTWGVFLGWNEFPGSPQ
ncbi:hypothetical protein FOA52_009986 [Chlamydomonas sp. UWO 241]|nr:hypothetical protein FOA52_009986 [Chlamydomonas sp. UWO 241]